MTDTLSDKDIVKLCADAEGIQCSLLAGNWRIDPYHNDKYDPLTDDAQCFALIERFELYTEPPDDDGDYTAFSMKEPKACAIGKTLNAAVCLCVARMQQAREKGGR